MDNHCDTCGAIEDDAHLFFHCNLPWAVWFSFNPTVRTHNLPHEIDGVQLILQTLITDTTPEPLFSKILFTLWYIWKARNDYHFHRKAWTPVQVHTAAAAHLNTHTQAIPSTVSTMNNISHRTRSTDGIATTTSGM
jgi:hypothetical protein